MADSVEFQLKLQDQMTASLRSGAENALKLDQALSKLTTRLEGLEKEETKQKAAEEGMFEGAVVKGELFAHLIEGIADKVFELGKSLVESAIDITDFGLKAENALRHLNGETDGAAEKTNKMLAEAKQFSFDAALPVEKVTEAFLGLKRAGLTDEWVRPLTASAGSLAALTGHPEQFDQLTHVFENIALKGVVTSRSLMALTNAGISPAALAAKFGAKDFASLQHELEKKPIGAEVGLRAIQEVIRDVAHEKFPGEILEEDAKTFGGSVTRIKNLWAQMLDDVLNKKDSAFGGLRDDFSTLVDDIKDRLPALEAQFAATFDPIVKAVDEFIKDPNAVKNLFDGAIGAIQTIAGIIPPIIDGLKWISGNKDVLGIAATAAVAGPEAALGAAYAIERPKTERELVSKGYSQEEASHLTGKFDDGGPVNETGPALVHEGEYVIPVGGVPVVSSSGGGGGVGRGAVNAPITVNVHVQGGQGMTEQGLKLLLEEMLPGALVSPFEKLASTVGAM